VCIHISHAFSSEIGESAVKRWKNRPVFHVFFFSNILQFYHLSDCILPIRFIETNGDHGVRD
jgi:hypothetical protein